MTLPEYASWFLADIEHRLRDREIGSFTLVGIDLDSGRRGNSRTSGTQTAVSHRDDPEGRSRHVVIRLGPAALDNPARARWQLAHECFHLLDPWSEKVDGRPCELA